MFHRTAQRGSSIDKNPSGNWLLQAKNGGRKCFYRTGLGQKLGRRKTDQGQGGLDASLGIGTDFALHVKDHKTVSTAKEAQNNKVK